MVVQPILKSEVLFGVTNVPGLIDLPSFYKICMQLTPPMRGQWDIPLSKNFRSMPYSLLMQSISQITLISLSLSYCFPFSSNVSLSGMFIFFYPCFLHASLPMKKKTEKYLIISTNLHSILPTYRFHCYRCLNVNFSVAMCTQTTDNFALWVWVIKWSL